MQGEAGNNGVITPGVFSFWWYFWGYNQKIQLYLSFAFKQLNY